MEKKSIGSKRQLGEAIYVYAKNAYTNAMNNPGYGREYLAFNSGAVAACADILRTIESSYYSKASKLVNELEETICE